MTILHEDDILQIRKHKKDEYVFLFKKWDGKYKKFWMNFPFSLLKILSEKNDGNTKEYIIKANNMQMLNNIVTKKRNLTYNECEALLYDVGNQIQSLEMFRLGIPFLNLNDILVVNGKHYFYINSKKMYEIKNEHIIISEAYKRDSFFSPEMNKLTSIPDKLHWKSSYYSLGSMVTFCLMGEYVVLNEHRVILDRLYGTKLYWALDRCLEENTTDRFYLII
jgi:hypothetical protein|tara:strand:- start:848 stop:1510 length:663 start_codon:yes stop_codon:yes gene_type:complete